jgi:hypothetical protein
MNEINAVFHVQKTPHCRGNLARLRQVLRVLHFGNNRERRFSVFIDLERSHAVMPDQA